MNSSRLMSVLIKISFALVLSLGFSLPLTLGFALSNGEAPGGNSPAASPLKAAGGTDPAPTTLGELPPAAGPGHGEQRRAAGPHFDAAGLPVQEPAETGLAVGPVRPTHPPEESSGATRLGSQQVTPGQTPEGLPANAWSRIMEQIRQDRYRIAPAGATGYRAANYSQQFQLDFKPEGVKVTALSRPGPAPETDLLSGRIVRQLAQQSPAPRPWEWGLRLSAWGYQDSLQAVTAAGPATVTGNRIEYRYQTTTSDAPLELQSSHSQLGSPNPEPETWRPELVEWFINDSRGLEHGFTLAQPPAQAAAGPLVLQLAVEGGLTLRLAEAGQAILFQTEAGKTALRYDKLLVTDATGRELPAWFTLDETAPGQIKLLINEAGARYPLTVDPLLTNQVAKLTAGDAAGGDEFGRAVGISGDTVVVGAYRDDDNGSESGAAYIFSRNQDGGDTWGQTKKITAADGTADDWFGRAVGISGDMVIVGAPFDDDNGSESGSAYIFSRNQGGADTWGQTKKITAADGALGDLFGRAVGMSGDTVVVGAYRDDDNGSNSGAAYLFSRNQDGGDTWGQTKKITAADGALGDRFGRAVGISGDMVVVGANGDDDNGADSGSAYLFSRNQDGGDTWGQTKKITAADGSGSDNFARAVGISGDTVVVGANGDDDNGSESGAAYIFSRNQGGADNWGQTKKITAADGSDFDRFGEAVGISGDTVVVGARLDDDNGDNDIGAAYIFSRNQGGADNWGQTKKITAADGSGFDRFGGAVAISEDVVVVGADGKDDNGSSSGAAYTFARSGNSWQQISKPTAADGAMDDEFGYAVDISGDTVVVGAWADDTRTGSAYIFSRNQGGAGNWGQTKKITASDAAGDDRFGWSVAISGDSLVVGAPFNDDGGSSSGSAYIFERNQGGADNWGQVAKLTASDADLFDKFGDSVAISGDGVVIGAFQDDTDTGSAYIFMRNQGGADNWGQTKKITASDAANNERFGRSVGISGDTVVVGAHWDSDNIGLSGSAYIFERNQGGADNWGQVAELIASDAAAGDEFGYAVDISGDSVVVGARFDDDGGSDSGSAYIFERNQGGADTWGQTQKVVATDGSGGDRFGAAVGIGGDTVVVGAYGDDDNGSDSGSAYIFERNQGGADNWGQTQKVVAADGAGGNEFGAAMGISGDTVVVGAYQDDDNGANSGSAYIFKLTIAPEIELYGKGQSIPAGDTSPTASDDTDFGDTLVAGGSVTHTFTISNSGLATLNLTGSPPVTLANSSHFSVTAQPGSTSVASNSAITFEITFNPSTVGSLTDTVNIANDDADENPYTFVISGTGTATTTTSITTDAPDPSVVGQSYVVTATVTSGAGTPTGAVDVADGEGNSCTITLSGGTGSCNLTSTLAGTKTLTATYSGNSNFNSSSDTEPHTVNKAGTTTTITADTPDPSAVGQAYLVTATVAAAAPGSGTPGGTVPVGDGDGNSCTITLSGGTGSCNLTSTLAGTKTLTATYSGDSNFNSSSDTEEHRVNAYDLVVGKADADRTVGPTTTITYTISIQNVGNTNASGVVISDTLPVSVTFVISSATNGSSYDPATSIWNVGNINADTGVTLTVVVTGLSIAGQTITNTAALSDSTPTDTNTGNNSASATTTPDINNFLPILFKNN